MRSSITLVPNWIDSKSNNIADKLSRWVDKKELTLNPVLFSILDQNYGPHTIDRFSTKTNWLTTRYNSLTYFSTSTGQDALTQSNWENEVNWANPPFSLLNKVVDLLYKNPKINATIIVPLWP